jgi:multicomponent Na+:H+ antiporter subunit G
MALAVDILSWFCLVAGAVFAIIAGLGILRFPDVFSRMHAAGIGDTLAAWLILLGMMLQAGWTLVTVKLILILIFLVLTSPTSSHALARAALADGLKPWRRGDRA